MKIKTVLKMTLVVVIAMKASIWEVTGQTLSSATASNSKQTARDEYNGILLNQDTPSLNMYPQGFLMDLQAMGNGPYPPVQPAMSKSHVSTFSQPSGGGGGATPNDNQSDPPMYTLIDLGPAESSPTNEIDYANAISGIGQVAGYGDTGDLSFHVRIYLNNSVQDLGVLAGYNSSYAYGINNKGQVVGYADDITGNNLRAFLYKDGTMYNLGTLGGNYSLAYGINTKGQIIGYSATAVDSNNQTSEHAFLYENGSMNDINSLLNSTGGESHAYGINNKGDITGTMMSGNAFLYSGGGVQDLGTLGGSGSSGSGINDNDQVAGYSYLVNGSYHAFLYSDGLMKDLGSLSSYPSYANGINNSGQVVGYSWPDPYYPHAFLYSNGTMYDLNDLVVAKNQTVSLRQATAINDVGEIVGYASFGGYNHGFLLNPLPSGWKDVITAQPDIPTYGIFR
jgi:probable HAF family extracellular repeat protein